MIIVNHHPQGGKAKTLASTHEYMITCVNGSSSRTLAGRMSKDGTELRPFKRSGTAESNFRYGRPNSFYAILIDPNTKQVVGLEPPPTGSDYPTGQDSGGNTRVYPLGAKGEERVWRRSYESCIPLVQRGKLQCSENMTIYHLIEAEERTAALFSNWVDPRYNAGTFGANLLGDVIGEHNPFSYPKSVHTVGDAIFAADVEDDALCLDYFAGSGTTGHAVINLNREDGGRRRFLLVEVGAYFDTVLVPRIKKVTFSPQWKTGKPSRLASQEEGERSPHIVKVIRLESYEDTFDNLALQRTSTQQSLLDAQPAAREDFMMRYLLDLDTRGSPSLLDVQRFANPFDYKLKITRNYEQREAVVDLVETFNYLLGLRVDHMAARIHRTADFERDEHGRLAVKDGRTRTCQPGEGWTFRTISGRSPAGEKVLIVWRTLTGDAEQDNAMLDLLFSRMDIRPRDYEVDLIYVNSDNNLENLRRPDETWKVRLIEEDFHRLMWDVQDV